MTPGDWQWFNYPDGRKLLAAPSRAVIHCPDAPMTCEPEDQHVIAASPDLLTSLREMVALYDGVRDIVASGITAKLQRADAAIAKAEGR